MQNSSWRQFIWVLIGLLLLSILLPLLPTQDPLSIELDQRLSPPSSHHWLGTDDLGRDMLSRVLHGISLTVSISILALLSSLAIGVFLGAIAGYYYRRWPDKVFNWLADFITAVPFLVLIAALLSLTGPGVMKAYIVLTLIIWVSPARIVRAEVIKTLPLQYVQAERAIGNQEWKILFLVVLPTCVDTAVIFAVSYLPEVIALEAGLSFLGLGVQPPQPGLGKMIFDGISFISSASWVAVSPAAALFLMVLVVQVAAWWARRQFQVI